MTTEPAQISVLDARLAEIDNRLRTIQTGLADNASPPTSLPAEPPESALPPRVEVAPPTQNTVPPAHDAASLVAELRALATTHERLLSSIRALLRTYEQQLARREPPVPASELSVSAGPLRTTGAVREFQQELAVLAGVREVEVRGYEGGDRALLDVYLER